MNDSMKTTIYVGVSLLIAFVAFVSIPRPASDKLSDDLNQPLFHEFEDPQTAKSLEIVQFDDKLGEIHGFKVAQNSQGRWVIPSHSDYPADAETQLKEAATLLIGLQPLGVASDTAADHKTLGVIAPDKEKLKLGDQGVGTLVKMEDEKGKNLVHLVIGAKVKGADDQRFVRISTQDRVYVVKLNLDKLSTKFDTWIEKNLLKLNALDVETLRLKDYSVVRTAQGFVLDPRLEATVKWNSLDSKWSLAELVSFKGQKPTPTKLLDDEEVNTDKLNSLKSGLVDLQIVDVQRKPKGLTADLKAASEFLQNTESKESLFSRGFFPLSAAEGQDSEIYCANGEVYVGMKDGVEYVLRFGNTAKSSEGSEEGKLNRYLFVTARVDDAHFPPPNLEPESQDVPSPDEAKPAADEPKKGCDDPPAADAGADETKNKEEQKDEVKKPETKQPDPKADLDRIKKENDRRRNEYRDKKKKAADKVAELNARFADWYYVISEDSYKKIHLGRADIIRERKGGQDEGYGPDAFRKLQKDGLSKGKPDGHDQFGDDAPAFPPLPGRRP